MEMIRDVKIHVQTDIMVMILTVIESVVLVKTLVLPVSEVKLITVTLVPLVLTYMLKMLVQCNGVSTHVQKVTGIMPVTVNLVTHLVIAVLVLLTIVDVVLKVSAAQLKPIYITTLVSSLAQMDIMKIPPMDNVLTVTNTV